MHLYSALMGFWERPLWFRVRGHHLGVAIGALMILQLTNPVLSQAEGPTCDGASATIVGTEGDNVLYGTPGDDVIVGLGGNDYIYGGDGGS